MNINIDLSVVLQAVMIFGLIGGIKGIYSKFEKLNGKVDLINGGLKEVKVWKTEHAGQAEKRHEAANVDRRDLWDAVNDLRK